MAQYGTAPTAIVKRKKGKGQKQKHPDNWESEEAIIVKKEASVNDPPMTNFWKHTFDGSN